MLDQRRRRWADVVQMLYICFVFAGMILSGLNVDIIKKTMHCTHICLDEFKLL